MLLMKEGSRPLPSTEIGGVARLSLGEVVAVINNFPQFLK